MLCVENFNINSIIMEYEITEVGMGQMKIDYSPAVLVTRGLGSCIGIVIYDGTRKIGGLAHPMLPTRENYTFGIRPFRFVDQVVIYMVEELEKKGCKRYNLEAKLFGGAHMFGIFPKDSIFNVGQRNIQTAKEILASLNIKITAEDVFGGYGRSVYLYLETGKVIVKTFFYGEKEF